jgi:hypothetical protein
VADGGHDVTVARTAAGWPAAGTPEESLVERADPPP